MTFSITSPRFFGAVYAKTAFASWVVRGFVVYDKYTDLGSDFSDVVRESVVWRQIAVPAEQNHELGTGICRFGPAHVPLSACARTT